MVLSLTDPPGRAQHINYLEPTDNPGIFGPDSVSWRVQQSGDRIHRRRHRRSGCLDPGHAHG
jgi:hypothetical protein